MNKAVLIILAIIIVVGAGYLVIKGRASSRVEENGVGIGSGLTQEVTPQENATIVYTDNGFVPDTMTVKVGTTVTFVNNSARDMWVASNPHPTHTDLPGFDAKQGIPNGGKYTYTFTKAGSWGFHNHLNPSDMEKVVVE